MHAIPQLSPAILAARAADERADAHDGSWRVYLCTVVATCGIVVAFCTLGDVEYPLRTVAQAIRASDVVGGAATIAAALAALRALVFHHRSTHKGPLALACAVLLWFTLVLEATVLLPLVLVTRFGWSA